MNEERLQALLSVYRYRGAMPDFRAVVPIRRRSTWPWLAVAAAVVLIAIGALMLRPRGNEWRITSGIPRQLRVGDVINREVRLQSRAVGVIDVAGGTTLRLIGKNRFALTSGTIHAKTTSPPGVFVVDTPRAQAVDLGCEYTLTVLPSGSGVLHVSSGWVELGDGWMQSLVPQGAMATIGSDGRLSPPIFEDASPMFKEAMRRGDPRVALPLARRRDALTLLNLFRSTNEEERVLIYDRLNALVPAPPALTRDEVRHGNFLTVEAWWPDVLKASGVNALKKKKRMLPPT
ncbi:MAG: hypothetical protein M3041_01140 [Acidobacteriota bacterium]|nr:hypothetical protein [Acidobacteriota bacterium]